MLRLARSRSYIKIGAKVQLNERNAKKNLIFISFPNVSNLFFVNDNVFFGLSGILFDYYLHTNLHLSHATACCHYLQSDLDR